MLFSVASVILVSYLLSIISSIVRYYGFTIRKVGKELHISRGLLERIQTTVPYHRIQAISSTEGLLRQPFGLESISIISAGHQQGQQQRSLLAAPLIYSHEREAFFQQFFGSWELAQGISQQTRQELQDDSTQDFLSRVNESSIPIQNFLESNDEHALQMYAKAPGKAFFRYLRRPNYLWLFPTLLGLYWLPWIAWAALLSVPATLYGWIAYKDTELGLSSEHLYIRYRVIARKQIWIPKIRIQSIGNSQHTFQKRKKLYHVMFSVVSGSHELSVRVKDFSSNAINSIIYWFHR